MGAHEGRRDLDGLPCGQRADGAQHPQLACGLQSVPALDLDGRRSARQHGGEPGKRRVNQLLLGRFPGRPHGLDDAAAFARDLRVRGAGQTPLQFVPPVAAEHEVGMRIDEARDDGVAGCVDDARAARDAHLPVHFRRRADRDDDAVEGGDRGVLDQTCVSLSGAAAWRGTTARVEAIDAVDEKVSVRRVADHCAVRTSGSSSTTIAWAAAVTADSTMRGRWSRTFSSLCLVS